MTKKEKICLIIILLFCFFLLYLLIEPIFTKKSINSDNFTMEIEGKNYNIILITFDALGANYLSIYGFDKETAPNLKKFSDQSFIFSNSISQSGSTPLSLCSLFTSRYPFTDNLMQDKIEGLSYLSVCKKNILFLPYFLQRMGYHTYGIVRNGGARSEFGFSFGFDYFNEENVFTRPCAEATFNTSIDLVKNEIKEPFFLWIHNNEPHSIYYNFPYMPPEKYFWMFYNNYSVPNFYSTMNQIIPNSSEISNCNPQQFYSELSDKTFINFRQNLIRLSGNVREYILVGRKANISEEELEQLKGAYLGNIRYADENFGKFLKYIETQPFYNNTIIVITADHGESLSLHGIFDHNDLYQDIIHVPLLIHLPRQNFTRTIEEPVESVDIYPTIIDILGLNLDYSVRGENLFNKNRNKSFQFSEIPEKKILINRGIKFWIEGNDTYYYNLSQDNNELNKKELYEKKENILNITIIPQDIFIPQGDFEMTEEEKQELRKSGYWDINNT